jgi:hypothetical protein
MKGLGTGIKKDAGSNRVSQALIVTIRGKTTDYAS